MRRMKSLDLLGSVEKRVAGIVASAIVQEANEFPRVQQNQTQAMHDCKHAESVVARSRFDRKCLMVVPRLAGDSMPKKYGAIVSLG